MGVTLYPELVDYIYRFCDQFQTKDEKLAARTLAHNLRGMSEKTSLFLKSKGWFSDAEHIQSMISKGYESFVKDVAERIFRDHRDELELNLCPKCFKITRTPRAKQCRFCFYGWH